jgi:hypothetical protein
MNPRSDEPSTHPPTSRRATERVSVTLSARLMWKDQRGTQRFACVAALNLSEFGAYVECPNPVALPLYRLVQFQLERDARPGDRVPDSLRRGRVTAAVYRVTRPDARGQGQGFALRLMIEPKRRISRVDATKTANVRATA